MLDSGETYRLIIKPWRERRSLNQNALSHMWYSEISGWLIRRGKEFASPEWVKDAMKHTYLGYVEREMVDVVTGQTTVIRSLNLGCRLTAPADSEYMKLKDKQNG